MPAVSEIVEHETPIGTRFAYGPVAVIVPSDREAFAPMRDRLRGLAATHNAAIARFQPDQVAAEVREGTWAGVVREGLGRAFDVALTEQRAATAADAAHLEPASPVSDAFATDVWSTFRAADRAAQERLIATADLETLTALVSRGNRVPLDEDAWGRAIARFRVENRLVSQGIAARHPAAPTVNRPLVTGADRSAARAEVEGFEKAHRDRLDRLEEDQRTATSMLQFLGAVYAVSPEQVLDAALGREAMPA